MREFILGATWIISSLGIGAFGAWAVIFFKKPQVGIDDDIKARIGSLETKVNMMTAFRPKKD